MFRSVASPKFVLALVLTFTLGAAAHAAGERLTVELHQPFEVNGTVYEGGQVSVKVLRQHTPSIALSEVWVGDQCVGMLMAHRSDAPTLPSSEDTLVFRRSASGHLQLVGYALRGQADNSLYGYGKNSRDVRAQWRAPEAADEAVLVASR